MRPEKARRIVQKRIDNWLTGDTEGLKVALPALKKLYKKYSKDEEDFRSGLEVYGYGNSMGTMNYISDRWRCAFRVRWLIDGIESRNLV